tara:strand:- start:864 stop:1100 length:237 start_codon:yes stop_codon:yes gene_type:complete
MEIKNEETKREKFVRLAESRTNNIIKNLNLLGNLNNSNYYDYSKNDIDKIFRVVKSSYESSRKRFDESGAKNDNIFKL